MNTFVEDHDEPPLRSNRAEKLAEYLGRAIAGGVTRSVLLWGNPGTGKSCLARAVIDVLGLRCMRFRVEDLGRLSNSTVAEAIELFAPGAVIIDDLDRLNGRYEHLFEMLAFLKRRVKLVFGTINDRKKLPAPLRRPGRFDERREIQVIDHDVVRAMLGPQFQDDFELVKDWPIVYVEEYVTRRRFEAPEELAETVRELRECMLELEISNNGRNVADDNHDDDEEYEHDDDDAEELQVDQSDDLDEATEFTITIPTDQTVCHV
jgi:SpoVK/Ycf46/Vps4 family AAA+-type ATPase